MRRIETEGGKSWERRVEKIGKARSKGGGIT